MVYRDTSVTRTLNSYNSIIESCKKLEIFFRKRMQIDLNKQLNMYFFN